MRRWGWFAWAAAGAVAAGEAHAESADRVEAIQQRAWVKRGSTTIAPLAAGAFNDPFVYRGGAGLRLSVWPRSPIGFSLAGEVGGQTPSGAARVAQRELRARLRPAATVWSAFASLEASAVDGKLAMAGGIVPFELLLRAGAGASGVTDVPGGAPSLAFAAGVGVRWFASPSLAVETTLGWRSASAARTVAGASLATRDTVVSLEFALPIRIGGGP